MDIHFVLVTHFADLPDKHVESWGPIEPHELTQVFEEIDALPWYHWPLPKHRRGPFDMILVSDQSLLHESADLHLRSLHDEARLRLFHPRMRDDGELYLTAMGGGFGVGKFHGDLLARDPHSVIDYYFREAEGNVQRHREYRRSKENQPPPTYPPEPETSGYAAVLFPPRHVGKNPANTIIERMWGMYRSGPGSIVLNKVYDGRRAFAT